MQFKTFRSFRPTSFPLLDDFGTEIKTLMASGIGHLALLFKV